MMRFFVGIVLGWLCFSCASEPDSYTGPMWSKSMHMARIFLEDEETSLGTRLARAERCLDQELYFVPEKDARYSTTLLILGFIERVKGHDTVADSMLTRAVAMADTALCANWWEMSRFGRWWTREVQGSDRFNVYEALLDSEQWCVVWRGILEPDHPDIAVLTGVMAEMEQLQGHEAISDSLYAESLPILEAAGPPYDQYADVFVRKRHDLDG